MNSDPLVSDRNGPATGKGIRSGEERPNDGLFQDAQSGVHHVRLEQYEGPLDALLDLVKKQRIDILDIPIAKVTEQFLESIRVAETLDFEVSAEFVLMAATLVHIKSKMLLPRPPTVDDGASEDPREDLVQRLLEREKFLQAAQMLKEKRVIEENVWTAGAKEALGDPDDESTELHVSLYDLVTTFGDVLDRLKNEPVFELNQETVSVASRIQYLKQLLLAEDSPVSVRQILWKQRSPRALVATFLALLEMVKARAIAVEQDDLFGEIVIRRHAMFDEAFRDGDLSPASGSELEYLH